MVGWIRRLLARRAPWFAAAFAHMAFIAWSSHRTWEGSGPRFPGAGNLMHVPLYFALGLFTGAACGLGRVGPVGRCAVMAAVGWAALFGVTDEIHQGFVPGRTPSVQDALVDLLSAAAAACAVRAVAGPGTERRLRVMQMLSCLGIAALTAVVPDLLS